MDPAIEIMTTDNLYVCSIEQQPKPFFMLLQ